MGDERRLSDKTIIVLGMIADGYSYSQIVEAHPNIRYPDIFEAAEEALRLSQPPPDPRRDTVPNARMQQIKAKYPRAYELWTSADDAELAAMNGAGKRIHEMAAKFQRQPSAIQSRLAKLGLNSGYEPPY